MKVPHRNAAVRMERPPRKGKRLSVTGEKLWEGGGLVLRAKSEYIAHMDRHSPRFQGRSGESAPFCGVAVFCIPNRALHGRQIGVHAAFLCRGGKERMFLS